MEQPVKEKGKGEVLLTEHMIRKITHKKKYFNFITIFCGLQSSIVLGFALYWNYTHPDGGECFFSFLLLSAFLLMPCYYLYQSKKLLVDLEEYRSQRVFNSYLDMVNRFWRFSGLCAVLNCILLPAVLIYWFFFNM